MCGVGAIVRRWSRRRGLRLLYSWSQVLPGFEQASDVHARQGERDERDQHVRGGAGADVERHERLLIGEDADCRGRLAGAPRETSQIWLNTLKSQITDSIVMTIRLGLISGTVIC